VWDPRTGCGVEGMGFKVEGLMRRVPGACGVEPVSSVRCAISRIVDHSELVSLRAGCLLKLLFGSFISSDLSS